MFSAVRSFAQSNSVVLFNLHCSLIAVLLGLAIYRLLIKDWSDPYHCKALLHTGYWLDDLQHTNWQPNGCMLHPYKSKAVADCLGGRSVVFIGDSVTRVLFYGALRTIDSSINADGQPKHSDRTLKVKGVEWKFIWDPFLNSSSWSQILSRNLQSSLPTPTAIINDQNSRNINRPTLLVVGSGLWYLRQGVGIPAWKARIDQLFQLSSAQLSRKEGPISDELVLLPVEYPATEKLNQIRKKTIAPNQVEEMNAYLMQKLRSNPSSPIVTPTVMNLMATQAHSETKDGLHYSNRLAGMQARILFNLRCNNQLVKKFPLDKTCCFRYPTPNWIQIFLPILSLIWAPLGLYIHHYPNSPLAVHSYLFPSKDHLTPMAIFGASVILIFLSDRTVIFNKEQKQFDQLQFTILNVAGLLAGIWSSMTSEKGDLGFLNREQTDEWKGWMQVAILIYHYLAASQISGIYNPIRICVASYLFMTGYGHFTYYYLKKDFGFPRILSVLVRLNLLTLVLAYVMDTDYLSYYFSPLVSMWFLIIWITMYIGHQWNDKLSFLLPKLACSIILTTAFFKSDAPLRLTFSLINQIFQTGWRSTEWKFRVTLDLYIVFGGMLTSLLYLKVKEHKLIERDQQNNRYYDQLRKFSIPIGLIGLIWFLWFEVSRPNKLIYNLYHPYISIIPIASFIILRNSTEFLRSTNSKFFVFIGQCSLETFIIQFHFWLAADTKGILKVLPFQGHRSINFILSSVVFVFVSHQVSQSSGPITSWLCAKPKVSSSPATNNSNPTFPNHTPSAAENYVTRQTPSSSSNTASQNLHHHLQLSAGSSSNHQASNSNHSVPIATHPDLEKGADRRHEEEEEEVLLEDELNQLDRNRYSHHSNSSRALTFIHQSWRKFSQAYWDRLCVRALTWLVSFWILNLLTPSKASDHGHILPTH